MARIRVNQNSHNDLPLTADRIRLAEKLAAMPTGCRSVGISALYEHKQFGGPLSEIEVQDLLDYGQKLKPTKCINVRMKKGRPGYRLCHSNVELLIGKRPNLVAWYGVALGDCEWIAHSWAVGPKGVIYETTYPMMAYYGYPVEWVSTALTQK